MENNTKETLLNLIKVTSLAPTADNSQPFRYSWDGNNLKLSFDTTTSKGKTFNYKSPATLLSVGSIVEHIHQFFSYNTHQYKIKTDIDNPKCILNINADLNNRKLELPNHHPIFLRHTNRFSFNKKHIKASSIKSISNITIGRSRALTFINKEEIGSISRLAREASNIRFQTQEVHEWLARSLRFIITKNTYDGLDVGTLDLPPGGRWFLRLISNWQVMKLINTINGYKILSYIDANPLSKSQLIIAITGDQTPSGAIESGQLLTRIWIELNKQGIAVHPYYVVADQIQRLKEGKVPKQLIDDAETILTKSTKIFNLSKNKTLHMLFRVGYPTKQPPRSRRRPLDKIFTDLTAQ